MKSSSLTHLKNQVSKIFWITVAWTIVSVYQFLIGYASLIQFECLASDSNPFGFFLGSFITGIWAGIVGGIVIVFLWEKWLRSMNYGTALFHIFWTYTIIYFVVAIPTNMYIQFIDAGLPPSELSTWKTALINQVDWHTVQNFIFWLFIVMGTLIVLQVNDKYGPGVFRSFLLGKYFQPKREERIFMFLDLRNSTGIAEKLGEERYFNFIKDVFKDATPAILNSKGEIYQYVGDEIVVTWEMNKGIPNANCVQCFFEVQAGLKKKVDFYKTTYKGIVPEFKAGLHSGHVMAGEIGVVKRDIAFSGDVLNTAARIQSKCNELKVNILLSKFLLDKLAHISPAFSPQKIGSMALRGKEEEVVLFTV